METARPNQASEHAATSAGTLPEFWPARNPPRVRAVWIPWPVAVMLAPLFWLMPKRFGVHFQAAGFWPAVVATLLWVPYGLLTIASSILFHPAYTLAGWLAGYTPANSGLWLMAPPTLGEVLRGPLALPVSGLFMVMNLRSGKPGLTLLLAAVILLGIFAVTASLGTMMMAYVSAGERTRLLFLRAWRLTLWASTSLVVLGVALQAVMLRQDDAAHWSVGLTVLIYLAWLFTIIVRAGSRYAGPADGPAWQADSPVCGTCGYALTGLPAEGSCPECGTAVAESLPRSRRLPAFAEAGTLAAQVRAYGQTWWAAWRDREFYKRLAVRQGHLAAARFAIWTCCLAAILLPGLPYVLVDLVWLHWIRARPLSAEDPFYLIMTALIVALVLLLALGVVALPWWRYRSRVMHRRAIPVFYWTAWLPAVVVSAMLTALAIDWLIDQAFFTYYVTVRKTQIDLYLLPVLSLLAIPCAVIWRAVSALLRAIRQTQYANA